MRFIDAPSQKLKQLFSDKPIWLLIIANLYPIAGVYLLGWDYFIIVMLYIAETVIIGLYNVLKMAWAKGEIRDSDESDTFERGAFADKNGRSRPGCIKFFLIPFFLFHYNLFVVVQTIFVVVISVQADAEREAYDDLIELNFLLNILFIIISHGYSFYKNYLKGGEYKTATPPKLMVQPYKRIIIQQVTVIAGTMIIMASNAPEFFLILLIVLKIFFDIRSHYKVHESFSDKESALRF